MSTSPAPRRSHRRRNRFLIGLLILLTVALILPFLIPLNDAGEPVESLADPGGRFVTVENLKTYVQERGDGPPLVFIHGLFGSTFVWRKNIDAIAAAGYRVVTFDRPGAGLTDKPERADYSHSGHADFTVALMDALGIGKAVIVGHSAGAGVLAHLALRHPDRVERLIIVDGALVGASGPPPFVGALVGLPPVTRWARVGVRALFNPDRLRDTVASFQADPSFLTEADYAGYWRAFRTSGWDLGLIGLTRDSGRNRLQPEQLRTITARTLLIWGEADTWTPIAQGRELAGLLPNATLISYPGIGHQPMEEAADRFNADVIAFLGSE